MAATRSPLYWCSAHRLGCRNKRPREGFDASHADVEVLLVRKRQDCSDLLQCLGRSNDQQSVPKDIGCVPVNEQANGFTTPFKFQRVGDPRLGRLVVSAAERVGVAPFAALFPVLVTAHRARSIHQVWDPVRLFDA